MKSNLDKMKKIRFTTEQSLILRTFHIYKSPADIFNQINKCVQGHDDYISKEEFIKFMREKIFCADVKAEKTDQ